MKNLFIIIVLASSFIFSTAHAQTLAEAVQYSAIDYLGTARTAGVSGAFGALGGDQGAAYINPASVGTFRKGEFVISPTYFSSTSRSTFNNNSVTDNPSIGITAANMGLVFSSRSNPGSKWKTSNIIITYNKVTDFERNQAFEGTSEGTIVERFAERANGNGLNELDNFEAGVAYDALALFDIGGDLIYEYDAIDGQEIIKRQDIRSEGGMSELSLGWAGNYDDKLQFGFTLNFPFVRYESSKSYTEEAAAEQSAFKNLTYNENLTTRGSGVNLKVGIIAMPVKSLRIGLSVASPTSFTLEDSYDTNMIYRYLGGDGTTQTGTAESIPGEFEYTFTTPWRTTGSVGYMLNFGETKGFISAEADYLNYTNSFFNLTDNSDSPSDQALENDLNSQINEQLNASVNVRLGGEVAYDIYRARAGFHLSSSPYFGDAGTFFGGFSLGGGFRFDKFFFDVAYRTTANRQGYLPYTSLNENNFQLVNFRANNTHIATTFGFKFGA